MERFSTRITETYNLEQEMIELVSKLTNESKSISVKCTPKEFKVSFTPNFGNNVKKVFNVMESISKIANEYPYVENSDIDKSKFVLTLKK